MKTILLISFLALKNIAFSQINEGTGIYDIDSCNFEQQFSIVSLEIDTSSSNLWEIGKPQKQVFNSSFSDSLCIVTDTLMTYSSNNISSFILKIPTLYYTSNLSFKHKINSDTLKDGGFIEVSHDKGVTWKNVIYDSSMFTGGELAFHSENIYSSSDSLINNQVGFSGNSDWIETKMQWLFYLPLKSEIPDTVFLRFTFISDSIENMKDGWIIDNIMYSTTDFAGVSELSALFISMFPNPAKEKLSFKTKDKLQIRELTLYDILGNKLKSFEMTNQIDISLLESGMYFLEFQTDNDRIRKSFVKE